MALFNSLDIATGSAQTVKIWSKALMVEMLKEVYFGRFLGEGDAAAFRQLSDLSKGPGDQIKYDLLAQFTDYGVNGNTQLKGSEELLVYYQDSIIVNQKRQATAFFRLSQQRTVHSLRRDGMRILRDFFARVMDEHMFSQLCGTAGNNTNLNTDMGSFNAYAAPDANHLMNKVASGAFDVDYIDEAVSRAKSLTPNPIQPLKVNGREHYVLFVRPEQALAIRTSADWRTVHQHADVQGPANKIFAGALGTWNGVIIHECPYLPKTAGSPTTKHAVLCGANSAVVAFGRAFSVLDGKTHDSDNSAGFPVYWSEQVEDYDNEVGMAAGLVFGVKKTRFNSTDFGTIRIDTAETTEL